MWFKNQLEKYFNNCPTFIVNRSIFRKDVICEFDESAEDINWEED